MTEAIVNHAPAGESPPAGPTARPDRARLLKQRREAHWRKVRHSWRLYVLLILPLAYAIIFLYGPLYGLQIAFKNFSIVKGITGSPWNGLTNLKLFLHSFMFWPVLKNTLVLAVYELLALFPLPIVLALALNVVRSSRYRRVVQLITFAPHFISTVVVVGIMIMMLSASGGIVNNVIEALGGPRIDFFGAAAWRHTYVWSSAWQTLGFSSIIYLAALAGVDPQLHESARVDGAGILRRVWNIDLPGILPVMVTLLILNMGQILSVGFEKILLMQNSVNLGVSEVIDTYSYRVAFLTSIPQFSYAAAVGLFKSVISVVLLFAANWLARRVSDESLF